MVVVQWKFPFLPFFIFPFLFVDSFQYKPVVIIHGVLDQPGNMDFMVNYIQKAHPGTNVTALDIYHGYKSLTSMWTQIKNFSYDLLPLMRSSPSGINLIGYSQGGLISRGIISRFGEHNVDTFISLSSPQMGQYGDTSYLRYLFPHYVKSNLYKFFYTSFGQRISIANYWKDPHHLDLYRNYSDFLPMLNNEISSPLSKEFKKNFIRLKKLVLIGGPDDGVITPWQSSHFGFFDSNEDIVEMQSQKIYIKDSFGLKTMDKRKKLITYSIPGFKHLDWHRNATILDNYILPHLN